MCFPCCECGEVPGARDRLLSEHVEWKIAILDAGREIVELAAELKPDLRAKLYDIHSRLIRLEADDENDLQNILASIKPKAEAA
jgi:hypothetical protein